MEDTVPEYFSETFACMSIAYAAAHAEEPAEPGPAYEPTVDGDGGDPLSISLVGLLTLTQAEFEVYVRTTAEELAAAEAAELYIPEETDGVTPYSAINGGDIWRMTEDDSVNFFHDGEALGVPGLAPGMNEEGALDQDQLNAAVDERLAAPLGGYERVYQKDAQLMRVIGEYVKAHAEGPKEEHYREIVYCVKMELAEAAATAHVEMQKDDIKERLTELGLEHFESSAGAGYISRH